MTLVDTSVWIPFLEGGEHWTKTRLKEKIADRESIAYLDLILLEIVQGVRERKERERIETNFGALRCLEVSRSSVMLAAEIYQESQKKGITIRSIIDCLIAAVAIETGATVLHRDRDFDRIEENYPIVVEKS